MFNSFFTKFGLTQNAQSIYLYLLEHGDSIASIIGKRLNIKRVTIYPVLESLSKKRLINSFQKNNVTYFEAVPPEEIINICEQKIEEEISLKNQAKGIFKDLKKLESRRIQPLLSVKGRISYYQGLDSVKKLILETLKEGTKEQLCFGLNKYHTGHLWDDWKEYTKKRTAIKMSVRSIQPNTKFAKKYKQRDKNELRKTKLIPSKKFPANCELNIIGDMIAIFSSHGNQPSGIKLYDKEMAQTLKSLFELAWEKAREYDCKQAK